MLFAVPPVRRAWQLQSGASAVLTAVDRSHGTAQAVSSAPRGPDPRPPPPLSNTKIRRCGESSSKSKGFLHTTHLLVLSLLLKLLQSLAFLGGQCRELLPHSIDQGLTWREGISACGGGGEGWGLQRQCGCPGRKGLFKTPFLLLVLTSFGTPSSACTLCTMQAPCRCIWTFWCDVTTHLSVFDKRIDITVRRMRTNPRAACASRAPFERGLLPDRPKRPDLSTVVNRLERC